MGVKIDSEYPVSNEMLAWAQSLSGMITKIKTQYGGISEMVERPDWDDRKTRTMLALLKGLKGSVGKTELELADHVKGKYG